MVAMNGASAALAPNWARNQPNVNMGTLGASAMIANARVIATVPPTIHGRRRPNRDVV